LSNFCIGTAALKRNR